jgi:hypothetical protein
MTSTASVQAPTADWETSADFSLRRNFALTFNEAYNMIGRQLAHSSLLAFFLALSGCRSDAPMPGGPDFAGSPGTVGVGVVVPGQYALIAPYPNPFNPTTAIEISIPRESPVLVVAQNPLGDVVATLFSRTATAGYYRINWDASEGGTYALKSGLYFITMYAPGFSASRAVKFEY